MDLFNRKKVKRLIEENEQLNRWLQKESVSRNEAELKLTLAKRKIELLEAKTPRHLTLQCSPHQKQQPDKTLVDFAIELKMRGRKKRDCGAQGCGLYYMIPEKQIDQIINSKK
jgi:hypothetical protein